jgi:hypothetical protein
MGPKNMASGKRGAKNKICINKSWTKARMAKGYNIFGFLNKQDIEAPNNEKDCLTETFLDIAPP